LLVACLGSEAEQARKEEEERARLGYLFERERKRFVDREEVEGLEERWEAVITNK
jgi:hypothetical protein